MSAEALRQAERDFKERLGRQPGASPGFTIGPEGALLNVTIAAQLPFKILLEQTDPRTGEPNLPDEALVVLLREIETEAKKRGLRF